MAVPLDAILARSVRELDTLFLDERRPIPRGLIESLKADSRTGARELARKLRSRGRENRSEGQRLHRLLRFEIELWNSGLELVAGVDEAGMAPLAGPVVAAAVILPRHYKLRDLDDSKKILDETKRGALAARIRSDAVAWSVGRAEIEEIDRINIYHAGLLAMRRAIEAIAIAPHYVLVDGRIIPLCPWPQRRIFHGDALSASIAAASLIAKTTRDALMREYDALYPGYGFAAHKGYPTPEHCRCLEERGALPIHRRSFGRVRVALGLDPVQLGLPAEAPGADAPGVEQGLAPESAGPS